MKKRPVFIKVLSLILSLTFFLFAFASCKKEDGEVPQTQTADPNLKDLTGFTIVRDYNTNYVTKDDILSFKENINKFLGIDMPVKIDVDFAEVEKEILIGKTDRAASTEALNKLKKQTDKDAYIIEITENKICILGTTEKATVRAMRVFVNDYVKLSSANNLNVSKGKTYASFYDSDKILTLSNGVEIETVVAPTTLMTAEMNKIFGYVVDASSTHYPSIIELQHQPNPEDNGKLIAHFCLRDSRYASDACFMESTNGGKTWNLLSRPVEQSTAGIADSLRPGQMAHIYELPAAVGNYPAGTIVYASGSINYSVRSEIWIWYSTDCGKTWKQTAEIAEGGCVDPVPGWHKQSGVWEPFLWYDGGYLYCFYSDDTDLNHDQKLVYKRSKYGVNWENAVDVCTFDDPSARPGMFVMTKMGNGEYFMVYEYVSKGKAPIYYKTTKDITQWDSENPGTLIATPNGKTMNSAPSCIWVPTGGDCGTLIVSASSTADELFISFDYGKTWSTFENPMPYTAKDLDSSSGKPGYSAGFWLGADQRTVYFINTTTSDKIKKCRIQFTSFRIY